MLRSEYYNYGGKGDGDGDEKCRSFTFIALSSRSCIYRTPVTIIVRLRTRTFNPSAKEGAKHTGYTNESVDAGERNVAQKNRRPAVIRKNKMLNLRSPYSDGERQVKSDVKKYFRLRHDRPLARFRIYATAVQLSHRFRIKIISARLFIREPMEQRNPESICFNASIR
jgi:hypothetical protein